MTLLPALSSIFPQQGDDTLASSTFWWLLAATAVALELASGTFYLLLMALGFAGAALAAHLGAGLAVQITVAAAVAAGSVVGWYAVRRERRASGRSQRGEALDLDIGETVQVDTWNADGTATVRYRGAAWTALARAGTLPAPGPHRVAGMVGSRLLVEPL
jgi:membrane protein implicated in regulation of membrane protease activity